jgi:HlyD family secretion protein/adhesin transport system membrane fusion protein
VGDVVAIQHLEGGVIAQILVAEGERVRKGQPLLTLAALDTAGRLEQLKAKRATHLIAIEGERAVVEDRAPAFDAVVPGFLSQKAEQLGLYNARKQAIEAERTVLNAQKAQRESEVARLTAQLGVLRHDEKIAGEELALRTDLLSRKLTTRDRFYGAERDAADRQKQRMNARDQLTGAKSELSEYERKLTEFETHAKAEAQESIAKHTAELAEVNAALGNEQGRAKRLNLTAPVAGIVSGLAVKAVNAVVKPGETLMEIVPTAEPMVVIAEVKPQDIGQVILGQRADVRVSAFDYATFGTLTGTVDRISPTTFADQNGRQFYKVRVRLGRDYFGNDRAKGRVIPGMDVEVDVKTGARSILAYMLKPVTRTWDTALKEP